MNSQIHINLWASAQVYYLYPHIAGEMATQYKLSPSLYLKTFNAVTAIQWTSPLTISPNSKDRQADCDQRVAVNAHGR